MRPLTIYSALVLFAGLMFMYLACGWFGILGTICIVWSHNIEYHTKKR